MSLSKTAILFFSRTLKDEFSAKFRGNNRSDFTALYKFLVNKTIDTARSTGLPVIEVYSDQQDGNSFGERLSNSLRLVKEKGYQQVIVIGNDAPELTVGDIHLAEKRICKGDSVLGRDRRGGTYLIGLDLQKIDFLIFQKVNWNSKKVYSQLKHELVSVYELSIKTDVNEFRDIKHVSKSSDIFSRGLLQFFKNLLGSLGPSIALKKNYSFDFTSGLTYRGPPSF